MAKTIKLNETSLVCDKPGGIKCWKKGKEIKHPHPVKWRAGGEIVVLKRWKLEEILDPDGPINDSKFWNFRKKPFLMGPFVWCTPQLWVQEAGFVYEGDIDVKILFGDYSAKDQNHGFFKAGTWTSIPLNLMYAAHAKGYRSLWQIKDKIEACLNKVNYKNRELIIYRTQGVANHGFSWDSIEIFSEKRGQTE